MGFSSKIIEFVSKKSNLSISSRLEHSYDITQPADQKSLRLVIADVEEVITRTDHDGEEFLQLNLTQDRKILITRHLIGFKPLPITGLDMSRLPRVVTTVDLVSVAEAIEEVMASDQSTALVEADLLKRVYLSIVQGAERVGFNLEEERRWLMFNLSFHHRASA